MLIHPVSSFNQFAIARRLVIVALLLSVLCIAAPDAGAQTRPQPTQADLDAMRRRTDEAVRQAEAKAQAQRNAPRFNVDAIPTPLPSAGAVPSNTDLELLARDMMAKVSLPQGPQLIAFATLSMPKPSLDRLIDDAARHGVTVLIRGMVEGSIPKTAERVQKLMEKRQVAWNIDPEAFKRYGIANVPAYVFIRAGAEASTTCGDMQCFANSDFMKLSGDVPLSYALDQFETRPEFAADVRRFRQKGR
jgi:conjugal transfer pilus assembly protein TrbC